MTDMTVASGGGETTGSARGTAESWYAVSADDVAHRLGVDPDSGLSAAKAAQRLAEDGPNALPAEKPPPGWERFVAQYKSYMQIILVAAAVASIVIGQVATGVAVLAITALNALGGLRQQGKAESAMNALQSMLKTSARVRRDGTEVKVPADQVVVGDVVLLAAGDDVAADGRIVEASSLQIDESALTGESVPAAKGAEVVTDRGPGAGRPVEHGLHEHPGDARQRGDDRHRDGRRHRGRHHLRDAQVDAQPEDPPHQAAGHAHLVDRRRRRGLTIAIMFALGLSRGESAQTIFTTAIALALAAVPMAMPTVLQVILSAGSSDLAAHGAVVKSLDSVETLGSTSAINSDKTGTLTMNQVTVVEVIDPTDRYSISGIGYGLDGEVQHTAGHHQHHRDGDPAVPDRQRRQAGRRQGRRRPHRGRPARPRPQGRARHRGDAGGLPAARDPAVRPHLQAHGRLLRRPDASGNAIVRMFVKGAAPAVIGRASSALADGKSVAWGEEQNSRAGQEMDRLGGKGLRIMAAATKDLDPADFDPDGDLLSLVQGLQLTALVGMIDPPRPESLAAVRSAQDANIRVRMVTGDDVVTGAAIAKQLGIPGEAVLGTELAAMSEAERLDRIDAIGVVGRVAPEHKVLMVETLRKKGDVVAMTGDGVNDAPAIKAADIGIAMGTGTQVAKNAGRMILTDDNFATIVRAVSEGRKLYDNMLKYIRFMLVALVTYVVTFLLASVLNIAGGQPFSAVQILWINFVITAPSASRWAWTRRPRG